MRIVQLFVLIGLSLAAYQEFMALDAIAGPLYYSPDASASGQMQVWNVVGEDPQWSPAPDNYTLEHDAALFTSPDGHMVAVQSSAGLRLADWSDPAERQVATKKIESLPEKCVLHAVSSLAMLCTAGNTVHVLKHGDQKWVAPALATFDPENTTVGALPNGSFLLCTSGTCGAVLVSVGQATVWQPETPATGAVVGVHAGGVVLKSGTKLLMWGGDGEPVVVGDAQTDELTSVMKTHDNQMVYTTASQTGDSFTITYTTTGATTPTPPATLTLPSPAPLPHALLTPTVVAVAVGEGISLYELPSGAPIGDVVRTHGRAERMAAGGAALVVLAKSGGLYRFEDCAFGGIPHKFAPTQNKLMSAQQRAACQTVSSGPENKYFAAGAHVTSCDDTTPYTIIDTASRLCALACTTTTLPYDRHSCAPDTPRPPKTPTPDPDYDSNFDPAPANGVVAEANGLYDVRRPSLRYNFYALPYPRPASIYENSSFYDRLSGNYYQDTLYVLPPAADLATWEAGSTRYYALPTDPKSDASCPNVSHPGMCQLSYTEAVWFRNAAIRRLAYSMRAYGLEASNVPVGSYQTSAAGTKPFIHSHVEFVIGLNKDDKRVTTLAVRPSAFNGYDSGKPYYELDNILKDQTMTGNIEWTYSVHVVHTDTPYAHRHGISDVGDLPGWPVTELCLVLGSTALLMAVFMFMQRRAAVGAIVTHALTGPAGQAGATRLRKVLYRRPAHPEVMGAVISAGVQIAGTFVTLVVVIVTASVAGNDHVRANVTRGIAGLLAPGTFAASVWSFFGAFSAGVFYKLVPNRREGDVAIAEKARQRQARQDQEDMVAAAAADAAFGMPAPTAPVQMGGLRFRTVFAAKVPGWVRLWALCVFAVPVPVTLAMFIGYLDNTLMNIVQSSFSTLIFGIMIYCVIAGPLVAAGLWCGRRGARALAKAARAGARAGGQVLQGGAGSDHSSDDENSALGNDEAILGVGAEPFTILATESTIPTAPKHKSWLLSPFIAAARLERTVLTVAAAPVAAAFGYDPLADTDLAVDENASQAPPLGWWVLTPLAAALAPCIPLFFAWTCIEAGIWGGPWSPPAALVLILALCVGLLAVFGSGPVAAAAVLRHRGEMWAWPSLVAGAGAGGFVFVISVLTTEPYFFFWACAAVFSGVVSYIMSMLSFAGGLRMVRRVYRALADVDAVAKTN